MKFRSKLALYMVCLLALIFGIGGSLLLSISFHHSLEREKENALGNYESVLSTLAMVSSVKTVANYEDISYTLQQMAEQGAAAWSGLRLSSGSSLWYEDGAEARYLRSDMGKAQQGKGWIGYTEGESGEKYLQISGAFLAGEELMNLDMVYDISAVYQSRDMQKAAYERIFIVMILLCLLLAYSVSWILTRPISGLSRASRVIASGDLSYRARVYSRDEVGALTEDFNTMADKLEENMRSLTEGMERQERFMGSFAHELKTPMTSIIGYSDILRSHQLEEEERTEAAGYIFSEAKRLENLSFKLLELLVVQKREMPLCEVRPAMIVEEVAEYLRPVYAQAHIHIEWNCEEGTCMLEPDLTRSLLFNLVDNARKAIEDEGTIFISGQMIPGGCRIQVRDQGKGIPREALAHLTEAFYRVDSSRSREQGGAGLGLALCGEIATLHHGRLDFESDVGKGTTVTVELKGGQE